MPVKLALLTLAAAAPLAAQQSRAPAAPATLDVLSAFDGEWRGPATVSLPDGSKRQLTQTERVGPALGGAIRVIEGRSYDDKGADAGFNAFGIVSAAQDGGFEFRAYAQGRGGTFPMTLAPGRFEWVVPAGPGGAVRYTATVSGGRWHEEGWFERGGQRSARVFEMDLTRVGDTDWPAGRAVAPR